MPTVDFDSFKKHVINIMNDGRYENLILSGGEITLFEDLDKYLQFAASLNWFKKIQIQTNGRKLCNRDYLKRLIDSGVNEFFISVHGLEKTHDEITCVPGSFKEAIEGICNLEGQGVNIITNTVLTKTNYDDVAPLIDYFCKTAATEMHLWNYYPMEKRDTKDLMVSLKDFIKLLHQLLFIVRPSGKALVFKSFPECLSVGEPGFFDSGYPVTIIPDVFWRKFSENSFGTCIYREQCKANVVCWGLSGAYIEKFGDERNLLSPFM